MVSIPPDTESHDRHWTSLSWTLIVAGDMMDLRFTAAKEENNQG
jgi:hypothetical protein